MTDWPTIKDLMTDVPERMEIGADSHPYAVALIHPIFIAHELTADLQSANIDNIPSSIGRIIDRASNEKIIGPEATADLHLIREVRNVFAHSGKHLDFDEPAIVAKIDDIKIRHRGYRARDFALAMPGVAPADRYRRLFLGACSAFLNGFALRRRFEAEWRVPPRPEQEMTRSIQQGVLTVISG